MKSQVKRSPWRLLLGEQLLGAVLAHQLDAGLGQRRQVVRVHVLDRRQDLDLRADPLADPLEVLPHAVQHAPGPAWRPVTPSSRRWEKYRSGWQLVQQVDVLDLARRPPRRARASITCAGRACARRRRRGRSANCSQHLGADLVAAAADPGPDRGRRRLARSAATALARRSRRPAAASRSAASPPGSPSDSATGKQSATSTSSARPRLAREVAVHPRELLAAGLRVARSAVGPGPLAQVGAVHLPAHARRARGRAARRGPGAGGSRVTALGLVVGEDAEVERLVRALAHAALAGGEDRARRRAGRAVVDHPRQLQRGAQLLVAAAHERRRACAAASPRARARAPGPPGRRRRSGRRR